MSEMQTSTGQGISGPAAARYWQATLARDSKADGTFVLAVRSTHIYCRPSCPARRPLRRNVVFFHTREEAEKQGYRACLRCRPNEVSGAVVLVQRAVRHLVDSTEENVRLGVLASTLNTTQGTLRRAFRQVTGLKPRELAEALRIRKFKAMLRSGRNITDALYETGYGSSSRVYERSNAQLGMTPATYRKGGKGMKIGYTVAKSPLGKVLVAATERGVSAVYLGDAESALIAELREEYPRAEIAPARDSYQKWVREIVQRTDEPGFNRGAVPPGDSRRRRACRLSLGPFAQGTIAQERTRGCRVENHQRWRAWRESPGDGENYPRGFTRVTPFGQSCLNLTSPSGRFFIALM
jgi:AraC family transcriptional regulator of adaptative response/methylated-DNA-[protein]-cysteine methyltransferase